MLGRQLNSVRRRPRPVLGALAGGLLLGLLAGVLADHGGGGARAAAGTDGGSIGSGLRGREGSHLPVLTRPSARGGPATGVRAQRPPATTPPVGDGYAPSPARSTLQADLNRGVAQAAALGGEAAAAVWVGGDAGPVRSGPTQTAHRLWSTSKAVVTIAALQAVADDPDPVLRGAIADAIRRSDNCAIRRVIVGLQDRLAAGVAGTVAAFDRVVSTAGAQLARAPQVAAAEPSCLRYLQAHRQGLPGGDTGVAPEFGTTEWSQDAAIAFAHALSEGRYGPAGATLLTLMAEPKQPPLEEPPPPSAPPLDWGAGAVFPASWQPAWKAGWGGSQDDPPHFLTTQIVVLQLAAVPVAVTAIFVPRIEPPTDNPGLTQGPQALQGIFAAARVGLEAEHVGGVQ